MAKKIYKYAYMVVFFIGGLYFFSGCSTDKNGWAHRAYHNVVSRYNGYFNAKEIMYESEKMLDISMPDDYTRLLPVYKVPNEAQAQSMLSDMDVVLEKCSTVITKNSIRKSGKEYTKWVDDSYFLMGKAYYYKLDFSRAQQLFNHVAKKYKNQETKYDAMIWLARTYVVQENYSKAEKILDLLLTEPERPERLNIDIRKIYADIYMHQENYVIAIPEIRQAIELAKKKPERMRLTYLLGQLYKEEGERYQSMQAFERVLKMHPEYRLEFYAKVQMAMAYSTDVGGAGEVREMLFKMLKDEKFLEFQDQIYYALAEMDYSEDNLEGTISNLLKSTEVSMGNNKQKGLSFLRLGELYFAMPKYQKAQMYYDSCMAYLPADYENYQDIKRTAENLNDLVEQLTIIADQDSLQRVAAMNEDDRMDLINDIIAKRLEEEERKLMEKENAAGEVALAGGPGSAPGRGPGSGPAGFGGSASSWYFYNSVTREAGAAEFSKLWGNRPNEDNWRRSVKEQQYNDLSEMMDANQDAGFFVNSTGDTVQISGDWLDPNYYLKDLPMTPEAVSASNDKIVEAYYKLSVIYLEQMEDQPMSIKTLEELNSRFNPNTHTLDAYYRLYLMYDDEGNGSKSDYYKNKILQEYPNSKYAMLIKDPNYLNRDSEDFIAGKLFYEKIYTEYFKKGYYAQTVISCDEGIENYGNTQLKPKFELLRAISIGHSEGRAALEAALKNIAQKYSDNEYGAKANELLAGLQMQEKMEAEIKAKEQKTAAAEKEISNLPYTFDAKSMHNFVIIVDQRGGNALNAKNAISDFNRKNFKMDGLKVSAVGYTGGKQMVTVKSFKNAKQAQNYYRAFMESPKLKKYIDQKNPMFVVSFDNYALFYKDKDHENYIKWYLVKYADL